MLILYLSLWFTFTSPPPESPPLNGSPEPVPPRTVRTAPPPNNASFFVLIGRELFLFSRRTIPCAICFSCQSLHLLFSLAVTSLEVVAAKRYRACRCRQTDSNSGTQNTSCCFFHVLFFLLFLETPYLSGALSVLSV